jgi:hypothetical protein
MLRPRNLRRMLFVFGGETARRRGVMMMFLCRRDVMRARFFPERNALDVFRRMPVDIVAAARAHGRSTFLDRAA